MMPENQPSDYTIKFGRVARTIEYRDPQGELVFAVDGSPKGQKCIVLEHYAPHHQQAPRYRLAFERTLQFLKSRGFLEVDTFGDYAAPPSITAEAIRAMIQSELADHSAPLNSPLDVNNCLLSPTYCEFIDYPDKSIWKLWLVLEERPETRDGFKIVFDPNTRQFGVATWENLFVGFEGSFIQTLEAISSAREAMQKAGV